MKHRFLIVALSLLCFTCSKNDNNNSNCKHLLNVGVAITINLNLPQYNLLQFSGNSVYIANAGNRGVIVINTGTDFLAWDASDPNHSPSTCSVLTVTGFEATCGCDDENSYELLSGQPLGSTNLPCGLKAYRVEASGNSLFITN